MQLFKGALLAAAAVSVGAPDVTSAAAGFGANPAVLMREGLAFFALTALAVMLFPRTRLRDLAAGALAFATALELARLAPGLHLSVEPLDVLARLAGAAAAMAPVALARAFPIQRRGACPTSLAYLP